MGCQWDIRWDIDGFTLQHGHGDQIGKSPKWALIFWKTPWELRWIFAAMELSTGKPVSSGKLT
jgi:hypothetical protein